MHRTAFQSSCGRLTVGPIQLTPGFLFLAALLLYRGTPPFLLTFLLAAALHECAHLTAAQLLHAPVRSLSMTAFGCVLTLTDSALLPNRTVLTIAAAGPLANLLLALLCRLKGPPVLSLFGGENLLLALFNLMPVFPLDGAVLLSTALSTCLPDGRGERVVCGLSLVLSAAVGGLALGTEGPARLRILLFAGWMAAGALKKLDLSIPLLSGKIKKSVK